MLKLKKKEVAKLLRTCESARILIDDVQPWRGIRNPRLDKAYDLLLDAREMLCQKRK